MPVRFISVPELAERLGRSKESLYDACHRGEIPGAFLIGRKWHINLDGFEAATAAAGRKPGGGEPLAEAA